MQTKGCSRFPDISPPPVELETSGDILKAETISNGFFIRMDFT